MFRRLLSLFGITRDQPVAAPSRQRAATGTAGKATGRDFKAVGIIPGAHCCSAAKKAFGRKYLERDSPRLPLPGCTSPQTCRCRFKKYADRRQDDRRHPYGGGFGWNSAADDRRRRRGRRSTDQ
jgi:hypothetical protein